MEELLKIEGEQLVLNPHFLSVYVIASIWKRDHGSSQKNIDTGKNERVKHTARRELSWIWLMESWKSPFQSYTNKDNRVQKVKAALNLDDSWKEDEQLKEAREWYAQYQVETNPELRGLNSSRKALGAIEEFLDNVNLLNGNNTPSGAAIYKPKDIASAIKELQVAKKSVREMEEAVRKAQTVEKRVRGGGSAGRYED